MLKRRLYRWVDWFSDLACKQDLLVGSKVKRQRENEPRQKEEESLPTSSWLSSGNLFGQANCSMEAHWKWMRASGTGVMVCWYATDKACTAGLAFGWVIAQWFQLFLKSPSFSKNENGKGLVNSNAPRPSFPCQHGWCIKLHYWRLE